MTGLRSSRRGEPHQHGRRLGLHRSDEADCDGLGLVVFDTLSTCIAGQNECDSSVMSLAVANAKLIGRKLNCAVLIIHHPGKDVERGFRGHSSLLGDIDAE